MIPIPALPTKLDLASFQDKLKNSGIDEKLEAIAIKVKEEAAKVEALDVASLKPSALQAVMKEAQEQVEATSKVMLDAAKLAEPELISLQEEMGKALSGDLGALGGVTNLLSPQPTFDEDGVANGTSGIELPSLESLTGDISKSLTSLSGFDPGSAIPNIKFKKEPTFDEDGEVNGEQLVGIKFGIPAIAPIKDALEDAIPEPVVLKKVAETLKNTLLADDGMLAANKRSMLNVFKAAVTTEIVPDPSTGENIVYETQVDEDGKSVMVPAGFPSKAEFDAAFKQGREAAIGHTQKTLGSLTTFLGENTNTFQNLAGSLNTMMTNATAALPTKKPGVAITRGLDPVTGAAVDQANLLNITTNLMKEAHKAGPEIHNEIWKEGGLNDKTTTFFNKMGGPLPPGAEPPSFNEDAN
jgi:hypothetical protein